MLGNGWVVYDWRLYKIQSFVTGVAFNKRGHFWESAKPESTIKLPSHQKKPQTVDQSYIKQIFEHSLLSVLSRLGHSIIKCLNPNYLDFLWFLQFNFNN